MDWTSVKPEIGLEIRQKFKHELSLSRFQHALTIILRIYLIPNQRVGFPHVESTEFGASGVT